MAFVTGCQAILGIDELPDSPDMDASPDDAAACQWSSSFFTPCELGTPGPALTLDGTGTYVFDTDTGDLRDPNGTSIVVNAIAVPQASGMARVLFAESVTIASTATLRAVGAQSFILAAWNDATIAGTLDVSSYRDGLDVYRGAGADGFCPPNPEANGTVNLAMNAGGSGGAGGSAAGRGGTGGDSLKDTLIQGGVGAPMFQPTEIRGGCPGGTGIGDGVPDIGTPGAGGGAVLVTARGRVDVSGGLSAGGAGGAGGPEWAGGGGGGSGGLIVLEATEVDVQATAQLYANGGAGGAAAAHDSAGSDGNNAVLGATQAALGGVATDGHASDGGAGGFGLQQPEASDAANDSGGGGGGAVGYIRVLGADTVNPGADISPPLTEL